MAVYVFTIRKHWTVMLLVVQNAIDNELFWLNNISTDDNLLNQLFTTSMTMRMMFSRFYYPDS